MEFVLLTGILVESNPLDEIKVAIAKYPKDHVFRKKCEMAVAVREERPFDAIRIAVARFIAEQIERAFQSRSSLRTAFIQEFRKNGGKFTMDDQKAIATYLGVPLKNVQARISHLRCYEIQRKSAEDSGATSLMPPTTPTSSSHSQDLRDYLNYSDHNYIYREYKRKNGQLSYADQKQISDHLGVHVSRIVTRINFLNCYPGRQQRYSEKLRELQEKWEGKSKKD